MEKQVPLLVAGLWYHGREVLNLVTCLLRLVTLCEASLAMKAMVSPVDFLLSEPCVSVVEPLLAVMPAEFDPLPMSYGGFASVF